MVLKADLRRDIGFEISSLSVRGSARWAGPGGRGKTRASHVKTLFPGCCWLAVIETVRQLSVEARLKRAAIGCQVLRCPLAFRCFDEVLTGKTVAAIRVLAGARASCGHLRIGRFLGAFEQGVAFE